MSLSALVDVKFSYSAIYCYGDILTQIFFFFFQNLTKGVKSPLNLSGQMIAAQWYRRCYSVLSLCHYCVSKQHTLLSTTNVWQALEAEGLKHTAHIFDLMQEWLILAQSSSLGPELNFFEI